MGKTVIGRTRSYFEFLYEFNPSAAEKTDTIIATKVENFEKQPMMGVEREGITRRLLIIPEISMIVSYFITDDVIHILRVLHQKQKFPRGSI